MMLLCHPHVLFIGSLLRDWGLTARPTLHTAESHLSANSHEISVIVCALTTTQYPLNLLADGSVRPLQMDFNQIKHLTLNQTD